MSDPAQETPEQAIARLNRRLWDLKRLRAQIPMVVLQPYAEEAIAQIRDAAIKAAIPTPAVELPPGMPTPGESVVVPALPADVAAAQACFMSKQGDDRWSAYARWDVNGDGIVDGKDIAIVSKGTPGVVVQAIPTGAHSPPEWEILVLTRDGVLRRVKAGEVSKPAPSAAPGPTAAPESALKSGVHVKDRQTGKSGFITEIADGSAIIALDEGGFLTKPIADLEVI